MSPKRIVSIIIALLNAVLFVGLFLPYSGGINVLTALDPYSYIIIVYAVIGMIMCILHKKIEMNYLTGGLVLALCLTIMISVLKMMPITYLFQSVQIGYYVYFIDSIAMIVMTTIHGNLSNKRSSRGLKEVNGNVPTQTTNSLNMNVPLNNFKSLPVNQKQKKKAPMDMLMGGGAGPATAQEHMGELGLQSINISKDNLTGTQPVKAQPVNVQHLNVQPAQPAELNVGSLFQSADGAQQQVAAVPVQQAAPVVNQQVVQQAQPAAGQQLVQPDAIPEAQPQTAPPPPRPDLLAGSEMSGQMDASPYNPQNNGGSGIFF